MIVHHRKLGDADREDSSKFLQAFFDPFFAAELLFARFVAGRASGYIFKWLIAYSALLGAVGGVLIADYFLVCRTRLDLQAWGGSCWYTGGFHAAGLLAPAGEGHPLRAGVPGHRRTGRGDAVLDGPVPLCLVSRFRDVPPGILGPDAPAPRRGRVATRLLTTSKGRGQRWTPITTGSRSSTSGRGSSRGGRTSSATRCSDWPATWRGRRRSTWPAGRGTTPAHSVSRAPRIVGVDLSRAMIGLAEAEEAQRPLGVEYRVGDVRTLEVPGEFDLAFAAYLLNYAHSAEELEQMCRAVARALRPGGRFVTVNSNPAEPIVAFPAARAYGFSRRVEGELVEGAPVVLEFFLPEGSFEVTNYYLSAGTMEKAFRAAGLRQLRWHAAEVSPEGLREFGQEYWADFLAHPPVAFIVCVK